MKLAFIGKSIRENENRLPLHPAHLADVPPDIRPSMFFDAGYGDAFGISDDHLKSLGYRVERRSNLLSTSDIVIIPKPMEADLEAIREGALIWGWLHFVLYGDLADICIRRKHTVVTWEGMFETDAAPGDRPRHIFSGNNELAGYAGTLHALGLQGLDGFYGPPRKVAVVGYGYAGKAAVQALQARGFSDITVYTQRPVSAVKNRMSGIKFAQILRDPIHGSVVKDRAGSPFWRRLQKADIIVNCGGQDPENPFMYLPNENVHEFDHDCLIVDISCDPGMGFPFIRTTTFNDPIYKVGRMTVCAVDHTPGHLWDASTWQISKEVLRFLSTLVGGQAKIVRDPILSQAIEIMDGVVVNRKILSYQSRSDRYPHPRMDPEAPKAEGLQSNA